MTTTLKRTALLLLLLGIVAGASTCIMEDRVIEIVLNDTTCEDFIEYHISQSFTTAATIDYAEQINQILEDNDLSREDIISAHLVSASYTVTSFEHSHDWTINGSMTVERDDLPAGSPATLWSYLSQSVQGALGVEVPVVLVGEGVAIINDALTAFIAGDNPRLTFTIDNSSVSPAPSAEDPIAFEWTACIMIQVVTSSEIEVPDPL